jgi:outer membrane protein OmpA-like peptidoglycan-associated protein
VAIVRTRRIIDNAGADAVLAAAERVANANGARVVIAVVDPWGELIELRRTEGAQVASSRVAVDKARTAAIFVRPSREMEEQAKRLQTAVAELEARPTERGLVLTLGSDVLFDFDRYELKPGAKRTVERVADFLNEYPERKVLVEGFTDSLGSREYNMGLSERRANAVRMALLERGVDPDRIKIRGYGPDHPVASNDTEAGRQRNRRVEIVVSDDEGEIPERTVRRTHR